MAMNSVTRRQEIADHQVDHREPAPERAEPVVDQLGVSPVRDGSETHGHLLDHQRHDERKNDEGNEEANAITGAGRGIGKHARAVVLAEHHQNAGADQQPQQTQVAERAFVDASLRDAPAIAGPVHVLVRDGRSGNGRPRGAGDGIWWRCGDWFCQLLYPPRYCKRIDSLAPARPAGSAANPK